MIGGTLEGSGTLSGSLSGVGSVGGAIAVPRVRSCTLEVVGGVGGRLSGCGSLSGILSVPRGGSEYPSYMGAYEADALFSEQVFPTAQTVMRDDFRVHGINYTQAPNGSGVTVTIGG